MWACCVKARPGLRSALRLDTRGISLILSHSRYHVTRLGLYLAAVDRLATTINRAISSKAGLNVPLEEDRFEVQREAAGNRPRGSRPLFVFVFCPRVLTFLPFSYYQLNSNEIPTDLRMEIKSQTFRQLCRLLGTILVISTRKLVHIAPDILAGSRDRIAKVIERGRKQAS